MPEGKTCSVPGCDKPPVGRGWCSMHWQRMRRYGSLERRPAKKSVREMPCVIEGCDSLQIARGWCHKHYARWREHGTPAGRAEKTRNRRSFLLLDALDQLPTDECVLWGGTIGALGYGTASRKWKSVPAHRAVYEAVLGPVPDGLVLDHLCHNRSDCDAGTECLHRRCVNPAHLEPVTPRENDRRARSRPQHPNYRAAS